MLVITTVVSAGVLRVCKHTECITHGPCTGRVLLRLNISLLIFDRTEIAHDLIFVTAVRTTILYFDTAQRIMVVRV